MDRSLFLLIMLLYDRTIYKLMGIALFQTLLLVVTVIVMIPHFAAKALREYFTQVTFRLREKWRSCKISRIQLIQKFR
jgi:hypothetical protein